MNLLYNRPLFIDEANVARNLFDRGYGDLFRPLDHAQYAPPLYLVLAKLLGELFGYTELPLRLPAFLGGLLAAGGLYLAGRRLHLGYFTALPLLLLFVNPTVLRYVTELKPYGLDLGIATLLLAGALHTPPRLHGRLLWYWILAGSLAPWISLPAVFILAAVGLRGLYHDRRWAFPIVGWLLSFGILYVLVLAPSVGSGYLNSFHQDYFLPWPDSLEDLRRWGGIGFILLRLGFGLTAVALAWGLLLLVAAWIPRPRHAWLLLPLLIVLGVSSFGYYSLIERLMLFVLPGIWLFVAVGARRLWRSSPKLGRVFLLLATVVALDGSHSLRHFYSPVRFSDGRRLADVARGTTYRVHPLAAPVVDYYLRIHPGGGTGGTEKPYGGLAAGEENWLYDVLTAPRPNYDLKQDSARAAERGCQVNAEALYRAKVLRIKCP
ncbi:hypothetical protein GGR26_000946 [Lewinella marina]|uniref:Glycosyltransferase RgtA/B/C/D-like domain-containing protein n=1 Tax=Neolewinella marina TaxID=438751 RepID=A0A2G0CI69_9BACT|nr:hypothetical protein [Neolewinella marina]NJB85201.1 hypothetical protein [Neolewinella marina]PHK99666.1 hypothetical protein CGL56_01045 [Neolewinella marina]